MARRGRPRKTGARKPCGRLQPAVDRGHDLTLAHRAEIVGRSRASDRHAGYPLGALYLRGLLADPWVSETNPEAAAEQNQDRHNAGAVYRMVHDRLWGPREGARSNMGSLAASRSAFAGGDPALLRHIEAMAGNVIADLRRRYQRRLAIVSGAGNVLAQSIVDRVVLSDVWELPERDLPILRRVLAAMADIRDRD